MCVFVSLTEPEGKQQETPSERFLGVFRGMRGMSQPASGQRLRDSFLVLKKNRNSDSNIQINLNNLFKLTVALNL